MVDVYVNMGYLKGKEDYCYFNTCKDLDTAISYAKRKYNSLYKKNLIKFVTK